MPQQSPSLACRRLDAAARGLILRPERDILRCGADRAPDALLETSSAPPYDTTAKIARVSHTRTNLDPFRNDLGAVTERTAGAEAVRTWPSIVRRTGGPLSTLAHSY